jgi:hypothetical protein
LQERKRRQVSYGDQSTSIDARPSGKGFDLCRVLAGGGGD